MRPAPGSPGIPNRSYTPPLVQSGHKSSETLADKRYVFCFDDELEKKRGGRWRALPSRLVDLREHVTVARLFNDDQEDPTEHAPALLAGARPRIPAAGWAAAAANFISLQPCRTARREATRGVDVGLRPGLYLRE